MNQFEILKYYSNPEIQNAILSLVKDREVVGSLKDGSYLKRPDTLIYPKDLTERVKKGVVAFHCSVEKWSQPMQLSSNLTKKELNKLRRGFDFILDIDSKTKNLEHATVAAKVVYDFLKDLGVTPTIKFSGSRGFHIAISGNAFPEKIDFKETKTRYPEIPHTITSFIIERTREHILEEMIAIEGGIAALVNTVPSLSELTPSPFIDIDDGTLLPKKEPKYIDGVAGLEKGWGSRHLFRVPYSLHPKTWLVSLPIRFEDLKHFKPEVAKPEKVKTDVRFLVNKREEATNLLLQALDWKAKQPKEEVKEFVRRPRMKRPVPEDFFPPCIKIIINGLRDGKRRSLFTLATFLRAMNWEPKKIEEKVREWNEKNPQNLSKRLVETQLKWHSRQRRELLPANCASNLFYDSIGICKPDFTCDLKRIKNPVNYPFKAMKRNKRIKG